MALLEAIGFIVVSTAVFEVAKFPAAEEVFGNRRFGAPRESRVTLTRLLVIISVAVGLAALVFIFDAARKAIITLVYPAFMLVAAALRVVGPGVYRKPGFRSETGRSHESKADD